jgi:Amt family ammonium transporter
VITRFQLKFNLFRYIKFKTASGQEHSMEMRVRAGDAAKFAMALSEVMEGSQRSSENGSDSQSRTHHANTNRSMVFINNEPVNYNEHNERMPRTSDGGGGSSRGGSSHGGGSGHGGGGLCT